MNLNDIEAKANDLWQNHRWLFVLVAIPVAIFKFRSVIIDLLVADSKKIATETAKKDVVLAVQENTANSEANTIIKTADAAKKVSDDSEVKDNWYEKDKK
jgi:hypothetical protein